MKPLAILQHEPTQGPGFLCEYLHRHGIAFRIFHPAQGQESPLQARDFSGVVVLGSDHSVNDDCPWISAELQLLRGALASDIPVLGHCFGAQLLARAMGARVWRNACPNIGWSRVWITPTAQGALGHKTQATLFNWHYDTFEIPRGAARTMYGKHCLNKGFVKGRHWGFQGHLEVTEASVRAWCRQGRQELSCAQGPAVQTEAQMLQSLPQRTQELHAVASAAYGTWAQGLVRPCAVAVRTRM
ncbi:MULTISPECIES: type 1 glutamine amidotransferase [Simplicispira]|uniref:GMP synthase-like glutamine amidotransferase n=1 Tax=Simplicispira metamorpha TaxID=80881 RepID=A0A4R2MVR2_9BURK|nr:MULTISPECIES: type 1 glutamine amidotransferase [Simplicispira]MDD2692846.1 type 1 glutamine amidotransferase [Simplicispira sp.]TCP12527.1 GMP synthase-like glutamine amidotransferase [Simplicispira metamorpha]